MAAVAPMETRQVNGDTSSLSYNSAFFSHLLNYPVISDGVDTFKSNDIGQRSIKMGDSAYQTFASRFGPWFARPYQYVSPYVAKADTFGDQTLEKIDERFPAVKKPTGELYSETKDYVMFPYQKGIEGRDHVYEVFSNEYKKNEQQGLVAHGKAAVTTLLVVSNETLSWLSTVLKTTRAEASQTVNEKTSQ